MIQRKFTVRDRMTKSDDIPKEIIDYYNNILLKQQVPVGIKGKRIIWAYKDCAHNYPDNLQYQDPIGTFEGIPDICDG